MYILCGVFYSKHQFLKPINNGVVINHFCAHIVGANKKSLYVFTPFVFKGAVRILTSAPRFKTGSSLPSMHSELTRKSSSLIKRFLSKGR